VIPSFTLYSVSWSSIKVAVEAAIKLRKKIIFMTRQKKIIRGREEEESSEEEQLVNSCVERESALNR
jgi:hypothetical protein